MNTPIYDFVTEYMNSGISRLHMPGHKGRGPLGVEARDVTEIRGADVLCEAEGIIGESEANATALFGSGHSFYSTEGSSLAIRAMLFLALQYARTMPAASVGPLYSSADPPFASGSAARTAPDPRPVVLAARNAHKAFLYACALLDCDIEWIWPEDTDLNSVCACHPTPDQITARLRAMDRRPFAVYLTSPDYLGTLADVRGITEAVRDTKIPVLVDNAHGAYLHFLPESLHPLDLGAFMTCDSAHKTLPVLTGGAYLQVSRNAMELLGPEIRPALSLFASTSPSYLILQSLDLCNAYLADGYKTRLSGTIDRNEALKTDLREAGVPVLDSEPLKLVIDASGAGGNAGGRNDCPDAGRIDCPDAGRIDCPDAGCRETGGALLAEVLRAADIEPEFADADYLVLMLTPENPESDYTKVRNALTAFAKSGGFPRTPASPASPLRPRPLTPLRLRPLPRACSVREAVFAPHETLPVTACIGRVCGQPTVSCPPAIPIAVSGEVITEDLIPVFLAYGVRELSVVKNSRPGPERPAVC